jgi:hypothetical protein
MMAVAVILRALALLMLPFILFQLVDPFGDLAEWFRKAVDPNITMIDPSGAARLFQASREIAIVLAWLSLPPLLWLAADVAAGRSRSRGSAPA